MLCRERERSWGEIKPIDVPFIESFVLWVYNKVNNSKQCLFIKIFHEHRKIILSKNVHTHSCRCSVSGSTTDRTMTGKSSVWLDSTTDWPDKTSRNRPSKEDVVREGERSPLSLPYS